jgi:hypothetical protein
MSQPNFAEMSTAELRSHVLKYRQDDDALHALVDRIGTQGVRVKSMEHFIELVEQKLRSREEQSE